VHCPECGQGVPHKAAFCIHCGYRFPSIDATGGVPAAEPRQDGWAPGSSTAGTVGAFQPFCLTSFILGIASLLLLLMGFCCGLFALVSVALAVTAIVLGVMGQKQFDPDLNRPDSLSLGKVGVILGITALVIAVLGFILMILFVGIGALGEMGRLGQMS
jgi:hypothetical protein